MDLAGIGTAARITSAVVRPLVARMFVRETDGAGLVDRPVRVSALVRWRGAEKRSFNSLDMWKLTQELVSRAVEVNPHEAPVKSEERQQVAEALATTLFALGDVDMDDVEAVRLGHQALAQRLSGAAPDATRHLSADGTALYEGLLELSCLHILHFFTQRSTFVARTVVEQSRLLDDVLKRLDALVERVPRPGTEDESFERRYLSYVATKYGKLNVFGLDLSHPGRARWPLDTAYLSLELSSQRAFVDQPSAKRLRVEQALSGRNRVLLRGLAGSGKTTLVQWLAVSAAQDRFDEELAALRGRIPFVLPLRTISRSGPLPRPEQFLAAVGSSLHGVQPDGWADRVLATGRGILLIDGVDEVPESERLVTRRWLLELVELYPRTFFLVTTRPSAVDADWLLEDGFPEYDLLPLNQRDVNEFVGRWHDAVLTTTDNAEDRAEIEGYRTALNDTLRRKSDLYRLATNPLMCALICALHRDRHSHLPERRMDVYSAALSMLLVRRDKEREIAAPEGLRPTEEAQIQLLQRLAYWLIRNGRSEATQTSAVRIIREKLPAMPQMAPAEAAEEVFNYLLVRSGLLREPSPETVDFIHRTFQDYLGAKAAVEAEDLDLLAEHGRDDQWEDVVRMAVGHARDRERAYLLRRLVQIGDQRPELRRRYHLLAAAGLEHATTLDPAVRAEVARRAAALIPPENAEDAVSLAGAGSMVLDLLPDPRDLTVSQAGATLTTIARVGGEAALHKLSAYKNHPDPEVRQQLVATWQYFDARAFAAEILTGMPLTDITVQLTGPEQVACLRELKHVPHVYVPGYLLMRELMDALQSADVTSLEIGSSSGVVGTLPVSHWPSTLTRVTIHAGDRLTDLTVFSGSRITELDLRRVSSRLDWSGLVGADELRTLSLSSDDALHLPAVPLPQVTHLNLRCALEETAVPAIMSTFPRLKQLTMHLTLVSFRAPVDLSGLRGVPHAQVTLVDAGKTLGADDLDSERVTVVHAGRRRGGFFTRRSRG